MRYGRSRPASWVSRFQDPSDRAPGNARSCRAGPPALQRRRFPPPRYAAPSPGEFSANVRSTYPLPRVFPWAPGRRPRAGPAWQPVTRPMPGYRSSISFLSRCLLATQLNHIVPAWRRPGITKAVHLVGSEVNHRARLHRLRLAFHVCLCRPFDDDYDFFVFVLVGRMRFRARAEYGFVRLKIEPGMLGTTEERPALLVFVADVGNLRRVIDLRGQRRELLSLRRGVGGR